MSGAIIVKYAHLEQMLKRAFYETLGISYEIGDLATSTPRISELIIKIESICAIKNVNVDSDALRDFRKKCESMKQIRDLIAHGAWSRVGDNQELAILKTRGNWDKQTIQKYSLDGKFKSVTPEAKVMSEAHLKTYVGRMDTLINTADGLLADIIDQISS